MRWSFVLLLAAFASTEPARAQSTPPAAGSPKFIEIGEDAILSSRLIGLNVESGAGESMGRIEDVVFSGGEISGVVLSVGEVLGGGERFVAVDPSAIAINYVEADGKWRATMNADLEQLRSAPEFRYEGKWKR